MKFRVVGGPVSGNIIIEEDPSASFKSVYRRIEEALGESDKLWTRYTLHPARVIAENGQRKVRPTAHIILLNEPVGLPEFDNDKLNYLLLRSVDAASSESSPAITPRDRNVPTLTDGASSSGSPARARSPPASSAPPVSGNGDAIAAPTYRDRLIALYETYNPDKLPGVDATLEKFAGREEAAIQQLVKKYGPEPDPTAQSATQIAKPLPSAAPNEKEGCHKITAPPNPSAALEITEASLPSTEATAPTEASAPRGAEQTPPPNPDSTIVSPATNSPALTPRNNNESATTDGGAGRSPPTYRERLIAIYTTYNPSKLPKVDATLRKFAGREEAAIQQLVKKYGPEPLEALLAAPAGARTPPQRGNESTSEHAAAQPHVTSNSPSPSTAADRSIGLASQDTSPHAAARHASNTLASYRDRLAALYTAYDPSKLRLVDGTLRKYAGREEAVIQTLVKKYGPEPAPPARHDTLAPLPDTVSAEKNPANFNANQLTPSAPSPTDSTTASNQAVPGAADGAAPEGEETSPRTDSIGAYETVTAVDGEPQLHASPHRERSPIIQDRVVSGPPLHSLALQQPRVTPTEPRGGGREQVEVDAAPEPTHPTAPPSRQDYEVESQQQQQHQQGGERERAVVFPSGAAPSVHTADSPSQQGEKTEKLNPTAIPNSMGPAKVDTGVPPRQKSIADWMSLVRQCMAERGRQRDLCLARRYFEKMREYSSATEATRIHNLAEKQVAAPVSPSCGDLSDDLAGALRDLVVVLKSCFRSRAVEVASTEDEAVASAFLRVWDAPGAMAPVRDVPATAHAVRQAAHLLGQVEDLVVVARTQGGELQELRGLCEQLKAHVAECEPFVQRYYDAAGELDRARESLRSVSSAHRRRRQSPVTRRRKSRHAGSDKDYDELLAEAECLRTANLQKDSQIVQLQQALAKSRTSLHRQREKTQTLQQQIEERDAAQLNRRRDADCRRAYRSSPNSRTHTPRTPREGAFSDPLLGKRGQTATVVGAATVSAPHTAQGARYLPPPSVHASYHLGRQGGEPQSNKADPADPTTELNETNLHISHISDIHQLNRMQQYPSPSPRRAADGERLLSSPPRHYDDAGAGQTHYDPKTAGAWPRYAKGGSVSSVRSPRLVPPPPPPALPQGGAVSSTHNSVDGSAPPRGPCPHCLTPLTSCSSQVRGPGDAKAAFCFTCRQSFSFADLEARDTLSLL